VALPRQARSRGSIQLHNWDNPRCQILHRPSSNSILRGGFISPSFPQRPRRPLRCAPRRPFPPRARCARGRVLHPRRVEGGPPAALVVLGQLEIVALAVHPGGDSPDAGPGVEPCAERPAHQRRGERMQAGRLAGCSGVSTALEDMVCQSEQRLADEQCAAPENAQDADGHEEHPLDCGRPTRTPSTIEARADRHEQRQTRKSKGYPESPTHVSQEHLTFTFTCGRRSADWCNGLLAGPVQT